MARLQSITEGVRFDDALRQYADGGTHVIVASDSEIEDLRGQAGPDLILTPLVTYTLAEVPTYPAHARQLASLPRRDADGKECVTFRIVDELGRSVEGAEVVAYYSTSRRWGYRTTTNAHGEAEVLVAPGGARVTHFESVHVYPPHSLWPIYREGLAAGPQELKLQRLPQIDDVIGTQWWAQALGVDNAHARGFRGQGVRVGVIDSGIGPHPDLHQVEGGLGFTIGRSEYDHRDVDGHGTHVAGIIGANGNMVGLAPACALYSARVFPDRALKALNNDIAEAIRVATDEWSCDVLNLSIGGPYDELIEDRIAYAASRGVLCVAAAGNSGGPVEYPAAVRDAFSVSALGRTGTYPAGSPHELCEPESKGLWGNSGNDELYAANFTCNGPEVNACAPGVAIISTVPSSNYAVLDGTSMAAPMITAIAAILLSRNPSLMDRSDSAYGGQRGSRRTAALRAELRGLLHDLRLPPSFQGEGMPIL
jgi:subtilisin